MVSRRTKPPARPAACLHLSFKSPLEAEIEAHATQAVSEKHFTFFSNEEDTFLSFPLSLSLPSPFSLSFHL